MAELKGKRQPKTTKQQYELYVQYIEENTEMARKKDSDETIQHIWDRLTNMLNALTGPQRSKECWKKIFGNWRNGLRHKKRKLIIDMNKTGGGPESGERLKAIEERAVSAWGAVVIEGVSEIEAGFNETVNEAPEAISTTVEPVTRSNTPQHENDTQSLPKPTRKRKTVSEGDEILKKNLYLEEAKSDKIAEGLHDIADSINNLAEAMYAAISHKNGN